MNYAVTGGAGFIGSHLVRRLVADKHNVTVVDNLIRGNMNNLVDIMGDIHFEDVDIRDHERLDIVLRHVDGIFHQAALGSVPESWKDPDLYQSVNIEGTKNVFQVASRYHTKVVYASSASVYGNARSIPITEDAERMPLNPYGKTKLGCEVLAEKYTNSGVRIIGLRYTNVFGVGQNRNYAGVISKFVDRLERGEPPVIFGDGTQVRDFTFVEDVVDANILAMHSSTRSGFFNIGSGKPVSLKDLVHTMIRLSGESVEPLYDCPRPGDPKASVADISKAIKAFEWRPKTPLEDGLRMLFQDSNNSS